jgi:hypothetical protein
MGVLIMNYRIGLERRHIVAPHRSHGNNVRLKKIAKAKVPEKDKSGGGDEG